MNNLRKIYQENRKTYRGYRSGELQPVAKRNLYLAVFAILCAMLFHAPEPSLIRVVITVLGILSGFSFSILFFIANNANPLVVTEGTTLEHRNKIRRSRTLTDEIFFNVSYFIMITVMTIILSVILMLPVENFLKAAQQVWIWVTDLIPDIQEWQGWLQSSITFLRFLLQFAFWIFLIEAVLTFLRILKRIGFLFSERLEIQKTLDEEQEP
jgi:hypothetical protein